MRRLSAIILAGALSFTAISASQNAQASFSKSDAIFRFGAWVCVGEQTVLRATPNYQGAVIQTLQPTNPNKAYYADGHTADENWFRFSIDGVVGFLERDVLTLDNCPGAA